jgi:hypothetical protein
MFTSLSLATVYVIEYSNCVLNCAQQLGALLCIATGCCIGYSNCVLYCV